MTINYISAAVLGDTSGYRVFFVAFFRFYEWMGADPWYREMVKIRKYLTSNRKDFFATVIIWKKFTIKQVITTDLSKY
jgi:hypothetical protein